MAGGFGVFLWGNGFFLLIRVLLGFESGVFEQGSIVFFFLGGGEGFLRELQESNCCWLRGLKTMKTK